MNEFICVWYLHLLGSFSNKESTAMWNKKSRAGAKKRLCCIYHYQIANIPKRIWKKIAFMTQQIHCKWQFIKGTSRKNTPAIDSTIMMNQTKYIAVCKLFDFLRWIRVMGEWVGERMGRKSGCLQTSKFISAIAWQHIHCLTGWSERWTVYRKPFHFELS